MTLKPLEERLREMADAFSTIRSRGGGIYSNSDDIEQVLREAADEQQRLRDVLQRIRGWDMLDAAADGVYWKREIDAALACSVAPEE